MYAKYNCIYPQHNLGVYSEISVNDMNLSFHNYVHRYITDIYDPFKGVSFETTEDFWNAVISTSGNENFLSNERLLRYHTYNSLADIPGVSKGSHIPLDLSSFFESTYTNVSYSYYTLDKYNENLSKSLSSDSLSLLPIATRSIISNDSIVVERSPFKISGEFKTSGSYRNGRTYPYEIWIPWTLTSIDKKTRRTVIYFSSEPADSPTARYIPCVLPNVYSDGAVCFNSSLNDIDLSSDEDFRSFFFKVINEYYSGGWNTDLYSQCLKNITERNKQGRSFAYQNFISPEYSHYENKYTPAKFRHLQNRASKFLNTFSTSVLYKYFFEVLSTYDLKNTLDFYEDLIDIQPQNYVKSYQSVISSVSNTSNNYAVNNMFSTIQTNALQDSLRVESYSDSFPIIKLFNTNAYYPYLASLHKASLEENNFDYNSIINSSPKTQPLEDPFSFPSIQEIYARVFINNYFNPYSSDKDSNPVLYFSYDHKEDVFIEYPDKESYVKYVKNYIDSHAKELNYVN